MIMLNQYKRSYYLSILLDTYDANPQYTCPGLFWNSKWMSMGVTNKHKSLMYFAFMYVLFHTCEQQNPKREGTVATLI